jgi:hypothetical protein
MYVILHPFVIGFKKRKQNPPMNISRILVLGGLNKWQLRALRHFLIRSLTAGIIEVLFDYKK